MPGQKFRDAPCVNINKTVSDSGETHKVNLSYKIDADQMVYVTYSTGFGRAGSTERGG